MVHLKTSKTKFYNDLFLQVVIEKNPYIAIEKYQNVTLSMIFGVVVQRLNLEAFKKIFKQWTFFSSVKIILLKLEFDGGYNILFQNPASRQFVVRWFN